MIIQMSKARLLSAFVFAPLTVPLVYYLFALIVSDPHPVKNGSFLVGLLFVTLYSLPIAYLGEFLLGIPVWMAFRHYGVTSVTAFGVCGAFIGWLVSLLIAIAFRTPVEKSFLLFCVLSASASAIVFRVIVGARLPIR